MSYLLFVKPLRRTHKTSPIGWTGKMVNSVLEGTESPIKAESRVWRHIMIALGQLGIGRALEDMLLHAVRFSFSDTWPQTLSPQSWRCAVSIARLHASHACWQSGDTASEVTKRADDHLRLFCDMMRVYWRVALAEICRALLCSGEQSSCLIVAPLSGLDVNLVGLASALLYLSLNEWLIGTVHRSTSLDEQGRHSQEEVLVELRHQFFKMWEQMRCDDKDSWDQFLDLLRNFRLWMYHYRDSEWEILGNSCKLLSGNSF
ncbi:hypothetical protein K474DRAFT_273717 [Panus rudis PR-1116 ss-1]|nr:hypothetical protein K474DRAFT_273717 [Panus rudis PR-1116 ss-1]